MKNDVTMLVNTKCTKNYRIILKIIIVIAFKWHIQIKDLYSCKVKIKIPIINNLLSFSFLDCCRHFIGILYNQNDIHS